MAARNRFHADGKDHDTPEGFSLRRSNTYKVLTGRWKSFRRRRIIFAVIAAWLLYLFFKNMPTGVPPVSERYDRRYGRLRGGMPRPYGSDDEDLFQTLGTYEGSIQYLDLAKTVQPQMWNADPRGNVLFALSSLKSVSRLLPIACSMTQFNKTRVHFAFMGRDIADWKDIREMNGITESSCHISLHDARPNNAAQSSASRLEVSARAVLGHIHSALQLHTVLTTDDEERYFVNVIRAKASWLGVSFQTLPSDGLQSLSWISSLDVASLSHLDKIQIDIVIQAQRESSASLMRLLRSIREADYTGWVPPRITVELPNNVDPFLANYLSKFKWPAEDTGGGSRLVVRHRLDGRLMSPVQASMRAIESFYPLAPSRSHVLVLCPSIELSPNYFQFLMYTILEYKFGADKEDLAAHLMGISLDLPPFAPDLKTKAPYESQLTEPLVLWQAPTSNAALYFGDRWVELDTFLSYRLLLDPELAQKTPSLPALSHEFPAWLQPMLELMQTKGYYMMYPTFMLKEGSSALTVHRELAQSPEEFMADEKAKTSDDTAAKLGLSPDGPLTADEEIALMMKAEHRAFPASLIAPFLDTIGKQETSISSIPILSFDGERREWAYSWTIAWKAAEDFATSVGGCKDYKPNAENNHVGSLFCLADT